MMNFLHQHLNPMQKGALGVATSLGSTAVSFIPHIETGLRIAVLVVGLAGGVAALVSALLDIRRKRRENNGK